MAQSKRALLLCTSKYDKKNDLPSVEEDHRRSEICLTELGFTVTSLADETGRLTGDRLRSGVEDFLRTVTIDFERTGICTVVVVISGHGRERETETSGTAQEIFASDGDYLSVDEDLVQKLNRLKGPPGIIPDLKCIFILDCCRENRKNRTYSYKGDEDGPAARRRGRPIAKWELQHDFYFIFACDPGRRTRSPQEGGVVVTTVMTLLRYRVPITTVLDQAMRDAEKLDPEAQRAWVSARAKGQPPTLGWKYPPSGIFDRPADGPPHKAEIPCEPVPDMQDLICQFNPSDRDSPQPGITPGMPSFEVEDNETLTRGLLGGRGARFWRWKRCFGSCKQRLVVARPPLSLRLLLVVCGLGCSGVAFALLLVMWQASRGPGSRPSPTTSSEPTSTTTWTTTEAAPARVVTTTERARTTSTPVLGCFGSALQHSHHKPQRNEYTQLVDALSPTGNKQKRHLALLSLQDALLNADGAGARSSHVPPSLQDLYVKNGVAHVLLQLIAWGEPEERAQALQMVELLIWGLEDHWWMWGENPPWCMLACLLPQRGPLREGALCCFRGISCNRFLKFDRDVNMIRCVQTFVDALVDEPRGHTLADATLCPAMGEFSGAILRHAFDALGHISSGLSAETSLSKRLRTERVLYEVLRFPHSGFGNFQQTTIGDMVNQLSSDSDEELALVLAFIARSNQKNEILEAGAAPRLVQCLSWNNTTVQGRAANIISDLAKEREDMAPVAKAAVQPLLHLLFDGKDYAVRVDAAEALCTLASGSKEDASTIVNAGALPSIMELAPPKFANSSALKKLQERSSQGAVSGEAVVLALFEATLNSHVQFCTTSNPKPPFEWCKQLKRKRKCVKAEVCNQSKPDF